ncbi:coiled-coil domain-containing protein [Chloroflexota bacterium]
MLRKAILVALSIALLLVLPACTTGVSQEEYDAIMAGLNTVQDDIASLGEDYDALATELGAVKDDIATLEEEIENLRDNRVEEAWDRAQQRHTTIVQEIPFLDELEEIAPWIVFPDKPDWFDCARLCSMILDDDPTAYDAVCIVTIGMQEMYVRLSDIGPVTTMICQGGTVDYDITITRDEEGKIIQEMMSDGESLIVIEWIDTGVGVKMI